MFQTYLTIFYHLVDNVLHLVNQRLVLCLTLQFAKFGLLTGYHLVVADAHLFQQSMFVLLRWILLVGHKCRLRLCIQSRTLFFHQWRVRVTKLQFALVEVEGCDNLSCLRHLMYAEVVGHLSVFVYRQAITAVEVAGKGRDNVVFSCLQR